MDDGRLKDMEEQKGQDGQDGQERVISMNSKRRNHRDKEDFKSDNDLIAMKFLLNWYF